MPTRKFETVEDFEKATENVEELGIFHIKRKVNDSFFSMIFF